MTRRLTGAAIVAGVVGQPIKHSMSPLLHTAWIEAAGLDAVYAPFQPPDETGFVALVRSLAGAGVRGLNVTLPFKQAALALADTADSAAERAGAANLLLFKEGRVEARNTDGIGLIASLREEAPSLNLKGAVVVLLGAGGAARGAAAALAAEGAALRIVNRTLDRGEALARAFGGRGYGIGEATEAFDGAALVVNSTSAGIAGGEELDWPLQALGGSAVVLDMRYGPRPTRLVSQARARGLAGFDGLGMLIGQARPSFEAFYGVPPPNDLDAEALLRGAMA